MKSFLLSANIVIFVLLLSGCTGKGKSASWRSAGDTIEMSHSDYLTMVEYADYTLVEIRNPWDTLRMLHTYLLVDDARPLPEHLPHGTVVRTPLQRSLIYTSVHCSLLQQLDALNRVGGVCDLKYMNLADVQQAVADGNILDCGDSMAPDIERIIDLHPDGILLSPFENNGGYGAVEKLDIPLIECADYMETSPLGRAEWMRFYGRLVDKAAEADNLFDHVCHQYQALKQRALQAESMLTVIPDLKTGSTWYMPGGNSYIAKLYKDARIGYAFANDTHSGSVPMSFEQVFDKVGQADVWLFRYNREADYTYDDLANDFVGYTGLKAFKEQNTYACNTSKVSYYEEIPFRPDYLLGDLIQIFHPEIDNMGGLRYFCKLK